MSLVRIIVLLSFVLLNNLVFLLCMNGVSKLMILIFVLNNFVLVDNFLIVGVGW